jgi:hypothetical protein
MRKSLKMKWMRKSLKMKTEKWLMFKNNNYCMLFFV